MESAVGNSMKYVLVFITALTDASHSETRQQILDRLNFLNERDTSARNDFINESSSRFPLITGKWNPRRLVHLMKINQRKQRDILLGENRFDVAILQRASMLIPSKAR